ncbi:transporter substrate-binding domain-containing protein [Aquincola sp. S2]|uniref:Transporter substrate-binding domain-containing protein n=1 Tax=Pseudaquabacterium terrae TaxID=2732868 RepID=A0ABX2EE23_9BURK|nr:transporter substrate-binding domain-containing protein [Aquabacterium terrae]NRF66869.1 transporter substrate-binding domain-containing protein [Aquabacterium terrae]
MRVVGRLLLCIVCCLAWPAWGADPPDCSRPLSLALHEHGLLYSGQTGEGIDKDIADELIRRSGCRFAVTVMPRARIWQLIESGALDFSLSGITNEARDKFAAFAWYFSNRYYLLARKDAGVRSHADLVDNPKLLLGVIRSFRYSPTANRMVDRLDAQQRVSYASHLDPLFQVLLDNRVQAMIIEPFDYPVVSSGRLREETTILEFDDPPVPHGLIMSKKSLPPAQQAAWRALVQEMRRDGTMQRIFEKYFKPELAREMTQF